MKGTCKRDHQYTCDSSEGASTAEEEKYTATAVSILDQTKVYLRVTKRKIGSG